MHSGSTYLIKLIYVYLQSFLLISVVVSELCLKQSLKCKNEQRTITPKLDKPELQFVCTVHLLNEIDLPTQFLAGISCSFRVMPWIRTCG